MKVLIADDDRIVRALLKRILKTESTYEIGEAKDGLECWEILDAGFTPDICLLDIQMPSLTGLELLEKMRGDERFKEIPVLMITSNKDIHSKASAAALQSYAFVIKPFNPKKVLSLVKEAISSTGKVFMPYGFEAKEVVMEREEMDAAGYFKAMTYFVEALGSRIDTIEGHLRNQDSARVASSIGTLKRAADQVGGTLFLGYFEKLEALAENSIPEAFAHALRHFRLLKADYEEIKHTLEAYLRVVIESETHKKIVTQPDMTDWSAESIRLSAEIEESSYDEQGGYSLGNESILLRGFRGGESIASAKLEVKDGRVVIRSMAAQGRSVEIDLASFATEVSCN